MRFYMSSACSDQKHINDVLEQLGSLGFKHIELTGNLVYSDDMVDVIKRYVTEYGMDIIIHNFIPVLCENFVLNMASQGFIHDCRINQYFLIITDLLRFLKKNLYTIHAGFRFEVDPILVDGCFIEKENTNANSFDQFKNNILKFNEKYPDIRLAIENIIPRDKEYLYSFLGSPGDFKNFFAFVHGYEQIGLLLDLGHLNITANKLGFSRDLFLIEIINEYKNKIFALHVHDNNGIIDQHKINDRTSWQVNFIKKNRSAFCNIPIIFEWHNQPNEQCYADYCSIIEKIYV